VRSASIKLTQGIPQEKAKAIVKAIKDKKFKKAQASIRAKMIRVQAASKDELPGSDRVPAITRLRHRAPLRNYRG